MGNKKPERGDSIFAEDTQEQAIRRRILEQNAMRYYTRAKVHSIDDTLSVSLEGIDDEAAYKAQGPLSHPLLSNRFAGEPPITSAQRMAFDNKRREQEQELQLRLGLVPSFSTAPKPRP